MSFDGAFRIYAAICAFIATIAGGYFWAKEDYQKATFFIAMAVLFKV